MNAPKVFIAIVTDCLQLTVSAMAAGGRREVLSIVGSTTVYAFSAVVAKQFEKGDKFKAPKVESTGAGVKNIVEILQKLEANPDAAGIW